jgi:uncharacterized damage-inducible protein DinB
VQAQINAVVAALENAPQIVVSLTREIPEQFIKRRPQSAKWSAHEHAVHLAEVHQLFFDRLDLMLAQENPEIKSYEPSRDDEDGALLERDLNESLEKFAADRKILVEKLKTLSPSDWQRTARHEEYADYSIFIMLRHLALHDNLHAYRIEEILLKKDWN